jgi:lipopolysaccharide transport system permease protein
MVAILKDKSLTSQTIKQQPKYVIESGNPTPILIVRELWDYRELFVFFTIRKIKARYKQTVLGASWAIIRPFMTMIVFSIFFGGLAKIPSDGVPYPIFSYTALVPWTFFASGVTMAANSLLISTTLITKVYLPRVIFPISEVLATGVDAFISFLVLLVMMIYFEIGFTIHILWVIPLSMIAGATTLGLGFLLSAMNVQFRDIRHAMPFLVQVLLFLTPVAYPASLIENTTVKALYGLNPMVGVVEGFRWALLGIESDIGFTILVSAVSSIVILMIGLLYFLSVEDSFADII